MAAHGKWRKTMKQVDRAASAALASRSCAVTVKLAKRAATLAKKPHKPPHLDMDEIRSGEAILRKVKRAQHKARKCSRR